MDTATKSGIDAAKTASKRVAQKTTGDLLEIKQLIKLLQQVNQKKKKEKKQKKRIFHQKRDNKLLMT